MELMYENVAKRSRVRRWQRFLAAETSDNAEAVVLNILLDGWLQDLDFRLHPTQQYNSEAERQVHLAEHIRYANWLLDEMAKHIPEGQNMVCDEDRPLFALIRDAGLDLASCRSHFDE